MPTKILYLVSDLESGIGVSLLRCARRLDRRYEIRVCEFCSPGHANKDRARAMGLTVLQIGKRGVNPAILLDLLRVAREFRPALIQGFERETNFYACLLGTLVGARVIASFHGMVSVFRWFMAPFLYVILLRADRIVCVSSAIARRCLSRAPWAARRVVVIPNGVDTTAFDPAAPREPAGPRRRVTYVANFHAPIKGHEHLIRAVALLEENEAELWLVGSGAHLEPMRTLVGELKIADRVRFWGARHDVPEILAKSDVFVIPSLSEGCPHAVLEAMAAGVPIVGTRVEGILEILQDRVSGLLVPPGDAPAIRDAIRELAGDSALARQLRDNALRHVRESFDEAVSARRYEEIYEDAANR